MAFIMTPGQIAHLTLPACGPLGHQEYRFTITSTPPTDWFPIQYLGSSLPTEFLFEGGPAEILCDVNCEVNSPGDLGQPSGWGPCPGRQVNQISNTQCNYSWGENNVQLDVVVSNSLAEGKKTAAIEVLPSTAAEAERRGWVRVEPPSEAERAKGLNFGPKHPHGIIYAGPCQNGFRTVCYYMAPGANGGMDCWQTQCTS